MTWRHRDRNSNQQNIGDAQLFTATVRIDPLFDAPAPARAAGASVTFESGARTGGRARAATVRVMPRG